MNAKTRAGQGTGFLNAMLVAQRLRLAKRW